MSEEREKPKGWKAAWRSPALEKSDPKPKKQFIFFAWLVENKGDPKKAQKTSKRGTDSGEEPSQALRFTLQTFFEMLQPTPYSSWAVLKSPSNSFTFSGHQGIDSHLTPLCFSRLKSNPFSKTPKNPTPLWLSPCKPRFTSRPQSRGPGVPGRS